MGSDERDGPGNNIDNLTGIGKRSDTTILLHLSADRKRRTASASRATRWSTGPTCDDDNGQDRSRAAPT